jgi:hypothetical protein
VSEQTTGRHAGRERCSERGILATRERRVAAVVVGALVVFFSERALRAVFGAGQVSLLHRPRCELFCLWLDDDDE